MIAILAAAIIGQLPTLSVTSDDTRIDHSCRIVIAPGAVISDTNGDGVLHIEADGLTVEFAEGSVLSGAPPAAEPDALTGIGLRLNGHKDITLRGLRIRGYKVGLRATECPGLTIEASDLSGNYRQHLKSTPQAEDASDWLYPHNNDHDEWTANYGAALSIKGADRVTLRGIRIRDGQNGIILDRVNDSAIYDNDCSFLSGWGLALWRSSRNLICRNALDFCVRGYSHGVYNRGQDSAGLLMFEQCNQNIIAENSVTHGGDGIFGFAGNEAIGQTPPAAPMDYKRRGNSDNLFIDNDLSYAPAHGLEMTFSTGNRAYRNRFVENAICGIWGGYSNDMVIGENTFESNGQMAYGLERGGINIEHGSGLLIVANTFSSNACGVHLWWNANQGLLKLPGVAANERGVSDNFIADNSFTGDAIALQLRDDPKAPGAPHVRGTVFAANTFKDVKRVQEIGEGITIASEGASPPYIVPTIQLRGATHPLGARASLRGRQNIVMTEWGPWDHQSPLARIIRTGAGQVELEFNSIPPGRAIGGFLDASGSAPDLPLPVSERGADNWTTVLQVEPGSVRPFAVTVDVPAYHRVIRGVVSSLDWRMTAFPWEGPSGPTPPPDLEAWRANAKGPKAVSANVRDLRFSFGSRGPSDLNIDPAITAAHFAPDHFGIIATTSVKLPPGRWRIKTLSDDGVRVLLDGRAIIENWTHHGSEPNAAEFDARDTPVSITVEYFEIFGAAVLDVQLEPVSP